jgi:flagellar biosynthetic protein FliP
MVALLLAARTASAGSMPLLPDLNEAASLKLHAPRTSFVLTLITLLPAILMAMTPLVRLMVVFPLPAPGAGNADRAVESDPAGFGAMTWF